jgi:protein SCO1/2
MRAVEPKKIALAGGAISLVLSAVLFMSFAGVEPPPVMGEVPAFSLTDSTGKQFSSSSISGPYVASFIFTRCASQCPMVTTQMQQFQAQSSGLRLLSFSVDGNDKPSDLRRYAKAYSADWTFLTGAPGEVADLVEFGFRLSPGREKLLNHSKRLVLVDGTRRIRGYYDSADPEQLKLLASQAKLIR